MSDAVARVEFRTVRKHYTSGGEVVRAVDDVSLTIESGEFVALYGASGSGKSTLLRIAAGVLRPDAGAVVVDGLDVTRLSARDSRAYRLRTLGWIPQDPKLAAGASAVDNAALKLVATNRRLRAARRDVTPLLERLGLGERLNHRAETLSMGERQRVTIARALSLKPQLILADEPTGSLDSRRGAQVLELLREVTREYDTATLLVTHDERAVAYADRSYALSDGVLADVGPDLIARP
jgi:putative ABC transport system ATP-binding protein